MLTLNPIVTCLKVSPCLCAISLFLFPVLTAAQTAQIEGNKLLIPVATIDSKEYSLELTIQPATNPPELILTAAVELENADTTNASFYESGLLTVPSAQVGSKNYWGLFSLITLKPVTLALVNANIDDEDDDNDGLNDDVDPFQYDKGDENDPLGLAGIWDVDFRVMTEITPLTGTDCEGDPIMSSEAFELSCNADTGKYQTEPIGQFEPLFNLNGNITINNETFSYVGNRSEDGGITFSDVLLEIISPTHMEGIETWTWESGPFSCDDIQSYLIANKRTI